MKPVGWNQKRQKKLFPWSKPVKKRKKIALKVQSSKMQSPSTPKEEKETKLDIIFEKYPPYQILELTDQIQRGDEYWSGGKFWKTGFVGGYPSVNVYRRRIKTNKKWTKEEYEKHLAEVRRRDKSWSCIYSC